MNEDLRERIRKFNEIKYGNNDTRIIVASLKPDVTKAVKYNK